MVRANWIPAAMLGSKVNTCGIIEPHCKQVTATVVGIRAKSNCDV